MGYLETMQKAWDGIAEDDAFWAVLSDPRRKGNKWELKEFFETGVREVETVCRHLHSLEIPVDFHGGALDFGCGTGRLTQALASRFSWVVGADISAKMTELAKKYNKFPDSCRYITNAANSLPLGDNTLSFVYSSIALQHIDPRFAENYIAEFLRVLKPEGVMVFQVADQCKSWYFRQYGRAARVRIRRLLESAGVLEAHMQVLFLREKRVRDVLVSHRGNIRDVQFTNSLTPDFNGDLRYFDVEPETGYVSKQYCVVKMSGSES
jgi:SAM-dependent methyltransferase